jgi:hypothetical protein
VRQGRLRGRNLLRPDPRRRRISLQYPQRCVRYCRQAAAHKERNAATTSGVIKTLPPQQC